MSAVYEPDHPTTTFTVTREAKGAGSGSKRIPATSTPVGTFVGGYEDLDEETVVYLSSGRAARMFGRTYASAALDAPFLRGDLVSFVDPATGKTEKLEIVNRRGPFDPAYSRDHFELDLASEQPA